LRGLMTLSILSHRIGAEGYGSLASVLALSGLAYTFVLVGANTALTVFIPGSPPEQRQRDFWGVVQLTLTTAIMTVFLLIAFYPLIQKMLLTSNITKALYVAGIMLIPVNALQVMLYAQIVNMQQGKVYSKITAITSIVRILLLTAGAYWFGVIGVLCAMITAQLLLCTWLIRIIRAEDEFVLLSLSYLPKLKKYYTYGLTMFIVGLGAWLVDSSDRFIIGRYLGAEELGVYQVAYNLPAQLNQLGGPLFATLMPFVVMSINSGDNDKAQHHLRQSYKVLLLVFVPAVLLLSLNSYDVLTLLTTPEFVRGATIVPFVAISVALWQIVGVYRYNLHAHKRGHLLLISGSCAVVMNVGLNLLFVPRYGLMAAAVSTLVAYIMIFLLDRHFSRRSLEIKLDRPFLLKLTVAALGMAGAMLFVQTITIGLAPAIRFMTAVLSGGGTYLALVYFLRVFTRQEQMHFLIAAKAAFLPAKGV
jgi:O-antigen/teichoic acid export membrane protein